jgi:DNA-binding response OmpR family regulator
VTAQRTSTPPRLLVVDDDARYGQWLGHHLGVFCPDSAITVLDLAGFARWCEADSGRDCDILLLSACFGSGPEDPKARGLELLRQLRGRPVFPAVIALAEEGNELTAVRALHLGAVDYLPKRLLTPERLSTSVRLALRRVEKRVQRKLAALPHVTNVAPPPPQKELAKLDNAAAADTWASMSIMPGLGPKPVAQPAADVRPEGAEAANSAAASRAAPAHLAASSGSSNSTAASLAGLSQWATPSASEVSLGSAAPSSAAGVSNSARARKAAAASSSLAAASVEKLGDTNPRIPATADDGMAAATQLMAPGQLEAILNSASAAAMAADETIPRGKARRAPSDDGDVGANLSSNGRHSKPTAPATQRATGTPPPPVTAEFIPGYIIKMKIGESEKAVVYLANSISLGTNVALKVSKTLRDDAAGRQFLEREYTAIIAIRDPLVVQIYDYGVHAGFEYLAMEYLVKGDLKARMQTGLKEAEALRYVEQIAAALRVVHNAGLLHRDLKPPNVMLRENDEVALIDFGLARALDGSTPSTRTGVLRGSPYYMSPEQAQGEQLDARSDFYSLGIIFYEMLTGRKPYTGATAMEVLQQHVSSALPSLPHSLARYETLLHRLAAKNRNERFSQADEIIAAVAELRAAMPAEVESAVA